MIDKTIDTVAGHSKINPGIFTDENYYFISFLSDRFGPLNDIWARKLEERYGRKFKPIYVLPFKHNTLFEEENYVVLNERLFALHRKLNREDMIDLIYPEDLNRQFSEAHYTKNLVKKLLTKQGQLFIVTFTSVWLDTKDPRVVLLGPDPVVAGRFDNKIEHIKLFKKLRFPINKTTIYESFDDIRLMQKEYPFFISAAYSSGGFESKVIYTREDLEVFYLSLRPVNSQGNFIVAQLLTNIVLAPNTSAVVLGRDKTVMICTTDQLLRDNRYLGNLYPSRARKEHREMMAAMTIKVGDYLSRLGFRGLFGMDFLITKDGRCYPTDLNPRRQGGYYCNVLMSSKVDLIELEFKLALGERVPEIKPTDFKIDYCWAHSKLVPYYPNMRIKKELKIGDPLEPFLKVGSTYEAIFYPKDHIVVTGNPGFYLTTSNTYSKMRRKLLHETEELISRSYALYEGL